MSTASDTLGEVQGLAKALGLLNASGDVQTDWLSQPGYYLSNVLADQTQRDALVEFVDEILGGEERETDPDGLVWLPIVSHDTPHVTLYVVLNPTPADYVAIGVGVRLSTAPTISRTSIHVPVFRAAKAGHSVSDAILIGQATSPDAFIRLESEITLGTAPPLGGIGLSLRVPTAAGAAPQFALTLERVQLPGASAPRDISITASDLTELEHGALELVLGLARAQADALGAGPLSSVVGLLGLSGGDIPNLPLEQLATEGVQALADWFQSVMSSSSARAQWLTHLADLLAGTATTDDEVTFTLGAAQVAFGVRVTTGSGGAPIVTPTLSAGLTQTDVRVRAEAELLSLDLATRTAHALPRLSLYAQLGRRPDGVGTRLLAGNPQVDSVRVGITLDDERRPNFLLAADGVVIAGHSYPTLDLSSPEALAEAGGTVLGNVASDLLAALGPVGNTLRLLLGLTPPSSAPGAQPLNLATFLHDPLNAVRDYWRALLQNHPAGVVELLTTLRDLLADDAHASTAVSGTGAAADPWRVPIVGPVALDVWITGDVLELAISGGYVSDALGQRCTRVESRLSAGLVRLDLSAPSASFFPFVEGRVSARARGSSNAFIGAGPFNVVADSVGVSARWTPSGGVSVNVLAPNLAIQLNDINVPFALPVLQPDGSVALTEEGWDELEQLLGLLASAAPVPWVLDIASALGWLPSVASDGARAHLRLAEVAADPVAAIRAWLMALALDDAGLVSEALKGLARVLTGARGAFGQLDGRGDFENPYRLPILPTDGAPELVAWLLPDGPEHPASPRTSEPLRTWRPGAPGLPPATLARALADEAAGLPDVADLVSGRRDLAAGFAQLSARWTGADGRIVPPPTDPPGVTVHRVTNVTVSQLAAQLNLTGLLGAAPLTLIRVGVERGDAPLSVVSLEGSAPLPLSRVIDLRAPGLAPEAFAQPTPAVGEWFVALAERPDARLASGDADGIAGQAARLKRVLAPFASNGAVALLAEAAAGHAAIAAANDLPFVSAVVTLGTPYSPVAFAILDEQPGADAFRLLKVLLLPVDANETDDPDLACGRGMVDALAELLPFGDPGRELRPPATPITPRAGLAVHAVFGVLEEAAVLSGMTAIVAASTSARATAQAHRSPVNGARFGLRVNVAPVGSGITVGGHATLDMFGVEVGASGPAVSTSRALLLHLEIRRVGGWLVGGPGSGLGSGARQADSLRWLEANIRLPFDDAAATAEFVLHEPNIFGISRERWTVSPDGDAATTSELVTPTLAEVRALLAMAVEQIQLPAASTPQVNALLDLLRGLNVVESGGGAAPAAVAHLLYDPGAHVAESLADAARRTQISTAINPLLTGMFGVNVDLAGRRIVLDASGTPGERGMLSWTAHLEASAAGTLSAQVTLGSAGATAAGGALLRVQTGPLRATLEWHKPGAATPELIALWPTPNAEAIALALARLVPAELARMSFEYLRALDETSRPFLDAALDATGLLGPSVGGRRGVLLPVGLIADPISWLRHESAFGSAGGFSSAKVAALLEALKPIIGVSGNPGEWNLATGVKVIADSVSGNLRLGLSVDTSSFAPIGDPDARLSATGAFTLTLPPGVAPRPGVSLSVGVANASGGRQALYVEVGDQLHIFLRPGTGPDLPLYPDPPGLGQLAGALATRALPLVLDQLASQTGTTLQGRVGEIVRTVGDGLNLRTGATPHFDSARLQAWANDPAGAIVNALPTLTSHALTTIADAIRPVLPSGTTVTAADGALTVTVNGVALKWQPTPFEFLCTANVVGLPFVQQMEASISLDETGLRALTTKLGPAAIDAGGVMLRPYIAAAVGQSPAGGRRVEFGLATDASGAHLVAARWNLGSTLMLLAADGTHEYTDAEHIATTLLEAVLDLVASFAIGSAPVQQLLSNHVGSSNVRDVLRGVVLDAATATNLDANLFDPARLLGRLQKLAANLAGTHPSIDVGGGLAIGLSLSGTVVQVTLDVNGRIPLSEGDIVVSIEADSRWIKDQPSAGLKLGLLNVPASGPMTFQPSLEVDGIGVRIARSSGPLLDLGLTLGSVAVHLFGRVTGSGELSGGVQLQLSDLAVGVGGAQGGNTLAQGMMNDANSGPNRLQPAFSPALAVQKHADGPVLVSLAAGEGSGPWWLAIQKGFGPIYIEQVGFGVTVRQDQLERISLLLDGRVSIFGLTAAVDDLQLTFVVASDASPFDPSRYAIDLAGLAISADIAGLTLVGGLRKFGDGENVEYVGMLLARFSVYGLSVYGGYGSAVVDGQRFSAFFAFGAINGLIGGPPAFFLTGIGGGLGINRDLIFPSDLSRFGEFPFIRALDPAARPTGDPMAELASLRQYFPMKRGDFWFAAGVSFTSFSLVDGVAVLSVKVGDGFEIALLGLARMALPRPQLALVSIELALLARFSTKEGVLWIQAQLTDNSWLLNESVRLTGGFAFVTWFKGPNSGQFVLTMGGLHPRFHRDGYPNVPRLGFNWSYSSAIVIKGESYFALTSEAVMAGGQLQASAQFGPAWAEVTFGANGIVYFDPFWFEVEVYARISAGITIDLWFAEITISISIGASIVVSGPKFHGVATFEIGPVELSVEFGETNQSQGVALTWEQFVRKYLEEASSGKARVLTAIPGKGALPPGTGAGGTTETGTADGSAAKPFEVFGEFEFMVTTTVPTQTINVAGTDSNHLPSSALGIAAMNISAANTRLILQLINNQTGHDEPSRLGVHPVNDDDGSHIAFANTDANNRRTFTVYVSDGGAFPIGVWGPPQPGEDRKVPKGDVIQAVDGVRVEVGAALRNTLPGQVKYNQIETGARKPLPFVAAQSTRPDFIAAARRLEGILPPASDGATTFAVAKPWLAKGGYSNTSLASLERERAAPPMLGTLTQGLADAEMATPEIAVLTPRAETPIDYSIVAPRAIAILSPSVLPESAPLRTTAGRVEESVPRSAPPTLASVLAEFPAAVAARLVRVAPPAAQDKTTLIATGSAPLTRMARGSVAAVAARGGFGDAQARLDQLSGALAGRVLAAAAVGARQTLRAGEIAVLQMPNASRDVDPRAARPSLLVEGAARVVALAHGGEVLKDAPGSEQGVEIPLGTERVVVLALGERTAADAPPGLGGWHTSQELAYTGWATAIAADCVVRAEGASVRTTRQRFRAGWIEGAELVDDAHIVSTRFVQPVRTVAVVIDDPTGSDAPRGLSLTLEGADQSVDVNGRPSPPLIVVIANRSVLIYSLAPRAAAGEAGGPVTVTVASQAGWHLVGVLGGTLAPEEMAQRVTERGLDALLQPMAAGRGGEVSLRWLGDAAGRADVS